MEFNIENKLRPCFIDGKKALFHRRADYSTVVGESALLSGHNAGEIKRTYAIVEYDDGTVAEVEPSKIKFATGIFNQYSFDEKGE
ncbi:MAG: hypothetical protein SOY48_01670 [Eubacterium sp.]|nr:hypothetical protein [Eubacterium sp.]